MTPVMKRLLVELILNTGHWQVLTLMKASIEMASVKARSLTFGDDPQSD